MARHIGRYEVVTELGRGGFGHVYRCLDPSLGTHVAVKTLTADGDAGMLMRFRNEAATSRRLRHPNIVTIYDFGDQDGVPYIVMELLEGEDLQRAISWKEASELLTGLQRDFPDVSEIGTLAERLRAGQKKDEDERKLAAGLAAARAQFRDGELAAALASLEALAAAFPRSAEAGSMLAAVRLELESKRQRDIVRRSIEEGRQLAAKHEYEAAIKVFEAALSQYPADPELQRERRAVSAAGREAALRAALDVATSHANQLRKQGRFADAVKLLDEFLAAHGAEQTIASLRDALLAEQETARRSAELRDYMQRVNDLIAKDDLKNATLLLKASPVHVREDAELTRILGDAGPNTIWKRPAAVCDFDLCGRGIYPGVGFKLALQHIETGNMFVAEAG